MTPQELSYFHHAHNPDSFYFHKSTMRFFGDTMSNYKVIEHSNYYELKRKSPVIGGLKSSAFFDKTTFKRIHIGDSPNQG